MPDKATDVGVEWVEPVRLGVTVQAHALSQADSGTDKDGVGARYFVSAEDDLDGVSIELESSGAMDEPCT